MILSNILFIAAPMKPDIVHQSVTNSDGSFDTLAANLHESRDEDDSQSFRQDAPDVRDGAAAMVASKLTVVQKRSDTKIDNDAEESETVPRNVDKSNEGPLLVLLPSPTASFDNECTPIKNRDDSSFSFFGHSFDSVSHTTELEATFRSSPMSQQHRPDHRDIDISLPALSHSSSASMTDISPIKIDLGHHQQDFIQPIAFQYADEDDYQQQQQHWEPPPPPSPPRPYGYEQDRCYDSYAYSNPFFVLRSCSQAFRQCSFVLSHVQNPNPLSVHCSGGGSFHHHQNQGNVHSEVSEGRGFENGKR